MSKRGLGILGLGEGRSILSAALTSEYWEVAHLCDLSEDLCRERCREFDITPKYSSDYEKLLADPDVDTVGIYTPDKLHAEHITAALHAGKHVICTKPFLDNLKEARGILKLVESTGLRLFIGQSTRFFKPFSRQFEHFKTGELGEIITLEAQYHADHRWFLEKPWAREPAFKWLYGCISHPADLVRWYLGEIDEVMGYASLSANGEQPLLFSPAHSFHTSALRGERGRMLLRSILSIDSRILPHALLFNIWLDGPPLKMQRRWRKK